MIGRIIGIRTVKTPSDSEAPIITGRTEKALHGPTCTRSDNFKGMVYLVVDCSGSMEGNKISQVKRGILEFAQDATKTDYLVGLIKFDTSAAHLCEPKNDIADLAVHLDKINAKGSTNLAAAINMAREHLTDTDFTRVMVVATDGRPDGTQSALEAGRIAKADGIDIITIGTDDADLGFLKKLATSVELGNKVCSEQFGKAIGAAHLLLPDPRKSNRNNLLNYEQRKRLPFSRRYDYSFSG
jgi:uncharacterized protein YegL